MSAHGPDLSGIIAGTPRSMPARVKTLGTVGVLVGVGAAAFGFLTAPERTSASFIANFLYFFGICFGGLIFSVALMLTQGRWARPLKRIAESFWIYTPVLWILLLAFLGLGGMEIYPWMHEQMPPHKAIYLQPGFFFARQFVGLGFLILISGLYFRASLRADLGVVRERIGDRAPLWWSSLLSDWRGAEAEIEAGTNRQMRLAPVVAFTYASVFTIMAVDLSMSLAPYWFANMFPAWYFMSCLATGLIWTGIYSQLGKSWLGMEDLLPPKVYHDLGKLNLGLTMFWAYTLFAQYLPIWYGNMPEETVFVLVRTMLDPWNGLSKFVLLTCFLIPFALLTSRGLKKTKSGYLAVTTILAIGLWTERHWVVMPSVWKAETLPIGPVEIGIGIGMLSGMILSVTKLLSSIPPVSVTDPWMAPNPADVHVHPSSDGHHAH